MRTDPDSLQQSRQAICTQLEDRRDEIEQKLLDRIKSVAGSDSITDPEYVDGLPRAISAGVAYAFEAIVCSERHMPAIPVVLLSQARLAARNGLSIDAVVRRYSACHTHLGELLAQEVCLSKQVELADLLRVQGVLFDRLVAAASEEHRRESENLASPELRRLAVVKGMLAGEALDNAELRYDFGLFHIAAIASGPGASTVIKGLVNALDCISLVVRNGDGATWAWLGCRERPSIELLEELVAIRWPIATHIAIGEAAFDVSGWRQSHRQARSAFLVSLYQPGRLIRYAENPVLVAAVGNDLFNRSLRELYLAPLANERDGGLVLRRTLRAYFATGRNGASAASALNVSRQTVNNRLRVVERRIGRTLIDCSAELEVALQLYELYESRDGRLTSSSDHPPY